MTVYAAADVKWACRAFPASTSCPDALPVWLVGHLSVPLLEALGRIIAGVLASGTWPSVEIEIQVVLIPKPTGGETHRSDEVLLPDCGPAVRPAVPGLA